MKVLHVVPSIARTFGGPTFALAGYSRASVASGVDVTIASPRSDATDDWVARSVPEASICLFKAYGRGALLTSPALGLWLRRRGAYYDVVHVHGLLNPVSTFAASMCVRHGWPLVVRPFGTMSRYTFSHRRRAVKHAYSAMFDRANLRRAGAVHFTTPQERDESMWQNIPWADRAFVIPPPWLGGVGAEPRESRVHRRTVVFLSRLHPKKNVDLLLDAWLLVRQQRPDARLLVAGNGDPAYANRLRSRADQLDGSVTFVGHVEGREKEEILEKSDLFVLPSQHENFGIAVLEAMAAGLPVVVTPEVQLSEFVRDHALGAVSEGSAESLADSMLEVLDDDELSTRCREQGAALVAEHFSLQSVGDSLNDMYRFAIAHSPA